MARYRLQRFGPALMILLLALCTLQPTAAQEAGQHHVGSLSRFCADATRPTTLLVSSSESESGPSGTYALNWVTQERTLLTEVPFDTCNGANGLLYGHAPGAVATPESPALLFSSSTPEPRIIARTPTHHASDGSLNVYSFGGGLWASANGGLSWQRRRLPTSDHLFGMAVTAADGRALYLLAGAVPGAGITTPYTIYFSPDAGATWQRRGNGALDNGGSQAPDLSVSTIESAAAPVDTVLITTSGNSSGRFSTQTTYLSTDGGRTFGSVAVSGAYMHGDILHTREGLLRLSGPVGSPDVRLTRSTDGGKSWQEITLPFAVRRGPQATLFIYQAPAVPDALLLSDDRDTLWFSPNGGQSWQPAGRFSDVVGFTHALPLSAIVVADGRHLVLDLPDMGRSLTLPALANGAPDGSFFPETGHNLSGIFKHTWERNGGLAQFGYPRSEPLREVNPADGRVYLVQYFERNRFEHHPEFAGTPNEVLLGLLGSQITTARRASGEVPFQPVENPNKPTALFFSQTGHTLEGAFRNYWARNGAERIYGYPISEPFMEMNPADGQSYLVQYFERNRFEYHPEHAGTPNEVLLGLLGNQVLHEKGWN